jgi:hypothetical protein
MRFKRSRRSRRRTSPSLLRDGADRASSAGDHQDEAERFGPRSERSQRLLDQVGLLKELVVAAGEDGKISDGFEQTGQAQPT